MWALVVAHIGDAPGPEPPLVRDHRVVPCREAEAQRRCFRGSYTPTEHCVRTHRNPSCSRGTHVPRVSDEGNPACVPRERRPVRGVLPAPQRGGASTERFRRDRRGWTAGLTDATALSRSLLGEQSPFRCDRPPNRTFAPGAAFTLNAVFHVETPRVLSADGRFRDR